MRNLKKLLSVVLVVAMIAGLCAVGSFSAAAAEYSETTNYKEAAAVITGVGIMKGYEDGTMQYDKTVTREEAAKIICMALIGVDTAEKLSTAVAPFADVAANRWSAPFINYLKSQGIVNGKTATQFDPTAEVTAVEFAKMMLCAVGYGKAGEFVGASWDVNTITAANNNGVYTGTLAADLTAPATREQCMLYAFNTMVRVPVVNYNTAFQSYYVGTSVVSDIDTRVPDAAIGKKANNSYVYTLAYRNFKLESTDAGVDDYGRTAVKWTADGKSIVEEVCSIAPDYVLYGKVNSDVLYNTLGKAVVKDINASKTAGKYTGFEVYTDGLGSNTKSPATPLTDDIVAGAILKNAISDAGDTVELFLTETKGVYSVTAVVYKQYFAQVTKIDTAANKLYATVYTGNPAAPTLWTNCVADGDEVNIKGLKVDDYILVNMHKNGVALGNNSIITAIATPKTAVAAYGGTTFAGMFQVFDGQSTTVNNTMTCGLTSTDTGTQYTLYYDSLNNLVFYKFYDEGEATGTTSYLYVTSLEAAKESALSGPAAVAVTVVYPNGGKEIVKLAVSNDKASGEDYVTIGTTKYFINNNSVSLSSTFTSNDNTDFIGKFFRFTKGTDGAVRLSPVNTTYAKTYSGKNYTLANGNNKVTGNDGTIGNYTIASSTVVTVIDGKGNVVTYTGYDNLKALSGTFDALYTFASGDTKLKSLCLFTTGALPANNNYALCGGFWSNDANGDTVMFYVDGEYKAVLLDESAKGSTPAMFYYSANTIWDLDLSASGNTATPVTATYTGKAAKGAVNTAVPGGYATATNLNGNDTAYLGLGYTPDGAIAISDYYAWAIINDVDGSTFSTRAVKAGSVDATLYPTNKGQINASSYFFDSNTKIYDCRNNACAKITELPVGAAFIAYIDEAKYSKATTGVAYCEYIWIVG